MPYEMEREPRYEAVRFNDAGRERFLIVRRGDTLPVVVAEALSQSTGVLIAEAMNDEATHVPSAAELYENSVPIKRSGSVDFAQGLRRNVGA